MNGVTRVIFFSMLYYVILFTASLISACLFQLALNNRPVKFEWPRVVFLFVLLHFVVSYVGLYV